MKPWLKRTLTLLLFLLTSTIAMLQHPTFGKKSSGERLKRNITSPHYKDGKFVNQIPTTTMINGVWSLIKEYWKTRKVESTPKDKTLPVHFLDDQDFKTKSLTPKFYWLGHSTVIIEMDNQRILIDPVLSDRAAPFQFFGPKRFHPAPIRTENLPDIDAIIISHDHYDHLDYPFVKAIKERNIRWMVPLGVGAHLEKWGVGKSFIEEYDWWDTAMLGNVEITCTPARHFSGRSIGDAAKAFWASWCFKGSVHNLYYSGDTGIGPHFKEIGNKKGPFDLSIIQIGAYNKNWPQIHLFPEEGALVQKDLNAKLLLPVHWGTFNLAPHQWHEPVDKLIESMSDSAHYIITPEVGQPFNLNEYSTNRWWKDL